MGIYEERLEKDLEEIRTEVQNCGDLAVIAVENGCRSILSWDRQLAYKTIIRDQIINRKVKRIDNLCHSFVVKHSPTAGHLRFVSSVLRINIALERIGDYAVTICREMARLSKKPASTVISDLEISVEPATLSLKQALESLRTGNAELARGTKSMSSHLGKTFDRAFDDLVKEGEKGVASIQDLFALLVVFNRLSRVCDQATNICEETIFAAVGESKPPKQHRILFYDGGDCSAALLAVAIAQKSFPESGDYSAAGCKPGSKLISDLSSFMRGHDLSLEKAMERRVETMPEILGEHHIVVGIGKEVIQGLEKVPHHTVALEWNLDRGEPTEVLYEELKSRISDLMAILSGVNSS